MSVTLLMDCHVNAAITKGLRVRGIALHTAQELGLAEASDEDILNFAATRFWVVVTNDEDFLKLTTDRLHVGMLFFAVVYWHQQAISIRTAIDDLELITATMLEAELPNTVLLLPL